MSEGQSVDYEAVLADLRAKRDRLEAAIAGIEAMLGIRGLAHEGQKAAEQVKQSSIGPGAFLGLSIVEATKKYLEFKRQSQRTEEILKALQDGGIVLSGENPLNVVGSVLNRNFNSGGEIVKVGRGQWALAAWHPRLKKKPADSKNGAGVSSQQADAQDDSGDPPSADDLSSLV